MDDSDTRHADIWDPIATPEAQRETASWPNPAESLTNYYRRLRHPIRFGGGGRTLKVAIVGAGIAGLTAARELLRGGVSAIDIFEASNRIGGRLWTEPAPNNLVTPYELGAMRMPFFDRPGAQNSALEYYTEQFKLQTQNFPNPGSAVCSTGIWVNDGTGPDPERPYATPHLEIWRKGPSGQAPQAPHPIYREIRRKWAAFANLFSAAASKAYQSDETWWPFWRSVAATYWNMNFRDLVYASRKAAYAIPGDFGGLGMTEREAELFYVIGMGDGGWGAFYDVSALWVMRTMLCGFGDNLQLVVGKAHDGALAAASGLTSTNGKSVRIGFRGVQSLAECMLTEDVQTPDGIRSLAKLIVADDPSVRLFLESGVVRVERQGSGKSRLTWLDENDRNKPQSGEYDAVVVTTPTWVGQLSISFAGFGDHLRRFASPAMSRSHTIMSCKVFYPLKERFWKGDRAIPQVICTDTFIQSMYGYAYDNLGSGSAAGAAGASEDPGVLLASYTWEDDALKLVGTPDEELGRRCLDHIDEILSAGAFDESGEKYKFRQRIVDAIEPNQPVLVHHWVQQPTYIGCSKLYRQRSWHYDHDLLGFNRAFGKQSGLYFAGEAYSVEGGWTEPALRSAVDAVSQLAADNGGDRGTIVDTEYWCPGCVSSAPEASVDDSRRLRTIVEAPGGKV